MNRRSFLRFLGLAPVAAVVGGQAASAIEWSEPKAGYRAISSPMRDLGPVLWVGEWRVAFDGVKVRFTRFPA